MNLPAASSGEIHCRDGEIRTLDLVVPNDARYLAALHPEKGKRVGVSHNCGAKIINYTGSTSGTMNNLRYSRRDLMISISLLISFL